MADETTNAPNDPTLPPGIAAVVNPIISQTAPTPAAAQAVKADAAGSAQDVFSQSISNIAATGAQIQQAFKLGQAAAGAASSAGSQSAVASQTQSSAVLQAGQTQAQINYNTEMAKAKQIMLDQQAITEAHLGENDQHVKDELSQLHQASEQYLQYDRRVGQINQGSGNWLQDFFDREVNLPYVERYKAIAAERVQGLSENMSAETKAITSRDLLNQVSTSADTTAQAALVMKAGLATAVAQAQDPIIKDAQIQISKSGALSAAAEAASRAAGTSIEASTSTAHVAMEQQQAAWYGTAKLAATQDMNAKTQNYLDEIAKRNQDMAVQKSTNDTAAFAFKSFGFNPPQNFDVNKVDAERKSAILTIGQNLQNGGMIADNPVDAVNLLEKSGIPTANLPDGQKVFINHIRDMQVQAYQELSNPPQIPGQPAPRRLEGKELDLAVKQTVLDRLQLQSQDPENSPLLYKPESLNTVVTKDWGQRNPLIQTLRPLIVDGKGNEINNVPLSFNQVIGTANSLIQQKKITEAQAAAYVKDLTAHLADDNGRAFGFGRFNAPVDPERYNVNLSFGSGGTAKMRANLMSTADIYKALRLERSTAAAEEQLRQFRNSALLGGN